MRPSASTALEVPSLKLDGAADRTPPGATEHRSPVGRHRELRNDSLEPRVGRMERLHGVAVIARDHRFRAGHDHQRESQRREHQGRQQRNNQRDAILTRAE